MKCDWPRPWPQEISMARRSVSTAFALALAAAPFAAPSAEAGRFLRRAPEGDVAVAVSRFGNGTVAGPVRSTSTGYEVRKPSGTWIACRTSCSETLRVETIDFFENDGSMTGWGTVQNECGIFGCLDIRYPR